MPAGHLWVWDAIGGDWVKAAGTPAGLLITHCVVDDLNDIGDVNAPAPADNESLTWDAGTGRWIPELAEPAVHGAAKHTDVARTLFIPCGNYTIGTFGNEYNHDCVLLATGLDQDIYFMFMCPNDFVSVTSLAVIFSGVNDGGVAGQDWRCRLQTRYGAVGESLITHSANPVQTVDVAALEILYSEVMGGAIASIAIGDHVGAKLTRVGTNVNDTYAGTIAVYGLLMTYTAEQ